MLADILRAAEWHVELHRDHFAAHGDVPDHEWVPYAAGLSCAIISADKSMRGWRTENGLVRPVIERCSAKIFFVRGAGLELDDQAHAIGLARVDICRLVKQHAGTFMFARIHTNGSRIGEVQLLEAGGGGSKTRKKYGADLA